jgi:hypothetical protein
MSYSITDGYIIFCLCFQLKSLSIEDFKKFCSWAKGFLFVNYIFTEYFSLETENMVIFLNNLDSIRLLLNSR